MTGCRAFATLLAVGIVLSIGATTSRQSGSQWAPPPAPEAVQAFVKAALTERLRANDVPDLNLLQSSHRIGVRDVMPQAQLTLKQAALPEIDGYEFFLISPADAQATADRRHETVPFIVVDEPAINGNTATISIGLDTAIPTDPKLIKLCCCIGRAEFHRTEGGWTFVKWSRMECS